MGAENDSILALCQVLAWPQGCTDAACIILALSPPLPPPPPLNG